MNITRFTMAFLIGACIGYVLFTPTVQAAEGNQIMASCALAAGVAEAAQTDRIASGDDEEKMITTITLMSEASVTDGWTGDKEMKRLSNLSMIIYAIRWVFQEFSVDVLPEAVYQQTMSECLDDTPIEKMVPAPEGELTPNGKQAVEYTV